MPYSPLPAPVFRRGPPAVGCRRRDVLATRIGEIRGLALWALLGAAGLLGCATTGPVSSPQVDLDSHLLLAEIAREREQFDAAVEHYLAAALISEDPQLAELTAELAQQADLPGIGLQATERWRELSPEVTRASRYSGTFHLRLGDGEAALRAFREFVSGATNAAAAVARSIEVLAEEDDAGGATAIAQGLVDAHPDIAEGHYGLARLAMRSGDYDTVSTHSERAAELSPDWVEAQMLHARSLLLTGRNENGLALARQLAADEPRLEVRLQYAELLLSTGSNTEEAGELLDGILSESPGLPEAVRAVAFLKLTDDDLDEAETRFNELRSDPRFRDEAFYYLGRIAEMEEEYLQAMRNLSRVTEGNNAVDAQLRVAQLLYMNLDDPEGALQHLSQFGIANPQYLTEMLLGQGEILVSLGREAEGIGLLTEELERDPENERLHGANIRLHLILAQVAVTDERYGEAGRILNRALNAYPGDPSVRYSKALLFQERGRLRRAAAALETLVEDYPQDAGFLNALGYLLTDEMSRHEEASAYLRRALAAEPDNPAIIDSMGWVLFNLGEYEAALDYLERAFTLFPDPEVAAHIVDTHWALGNREQALELLRESLEEHADSVHLLELQQRLPP